MRILASEMEETPTEGWELGLSEYSAVLSDMDDIWSSLDKRPDKFELLDLPLGEFALDDAELQDILDWSLENMTNLEPNKIVHHDCMWAGTCSDKYHPGNGHTVECPPPVQEKPAITMQSTQPGRSLLLPRSQHVPLAHHSSSPVRKTAPPRPRGSPERPDTPQSLDEEETVVEVSTACSDSRILVDIKREVEDDEVDADDDYDEDDYPSPRPRQRQRLSSGDLRSFNTIASDHSYTLCKSSKQTRLDNLGVQTPSDSEEEEVDVETVNEKFGLRGASTLPTNPSILDKHQLQRSMASAMGARPPCRAPQMHTVRKRSPPPSSRASKHRKRQRSSKHPGHSPSKRRSPSSPNSDSDVDNIEKRSLHNDMERQRRIGLKNLFEELKREVPSIRDKERAPKVVVLREAAALCSRLQREEKEYEQLKIKQQRLMSRVRHLRMDLAARRPRI